MNKQDILNMIDDIGLHNTIDKLLEIIKDKEEVIHELQNEIDTRNDWDDIDAEMNEWYDDDWECK